MLQQINTIEDWDKIRTELHTEWCKIIDYQMKITLMHGLSWVLCTNCNAEFENTLRSIREKEHSIFEVFENKFSVNAMLKNTKVIK